MQDDSADLHGVSQQSITNICRTVAIAIARTRPQFLRMPMNLEEQADMAQNFKSICGFRNVIGCIDGTHIKIPFARTDEGEMYINRKGFASLNVQAVCDSSLRIRDIVARWHGSVHDALIFNESSLEDRCKAGEFRGRLLGDGICMPSIPLHSILTT